MRTGPRTLLIAFALIATLSAPAKALEIFGNTGLGNAGRNLGNDYDELAQGFTIGSTPYQLSSVDIGLRIDGTAPTSSQIFISLYTNNGSNNPGTLIGSFNSGSPSPSFVLNDNGVYRFNYTGSTTLTANTSYWIVVRTTPTSHLYDWFYAQGGPTDTPSAKNSSGVGYFGTRTMLAASSTWVNANANYSGLRYTVNVVPEPSTYALGLAGTLVLGTIARRRNRLAITA